MPPTFKTRCVALALVAFCVTVTHAAEAPSLLSERPAAGDFLLASKDALAEVVIDDADAAVVRIAANLFADDVERVTGKRPSVRAAKAGSPTTGVLAGTIGKSAAIDALIAAGKLDVSAVRGKWETFVIATVDGSLVIAGSDRRGTAFGLLELSEQIGVSPWYWWADSTPVKRETLAIKTGTHVVGPPSVKYRGFFLNDEDFGLQPWAAKTFDPQLGNIGPKTYARVFELMLRLKANYLWPAMHGCSTEFGTIDENVKLADEWAIVMGASHAEPMNRNNVHWRSENRGEWRYDTNRDGVFNYWEEWAKKRGPYEAVWTVGMRGIHDSGMNGPRDINEQVKLLDKVIEDQRTLLTKYVDKDVEKIPQAFMPYKEALAQYQHGLKLPDDVTLVWCEDNFGYLRQLSTPQEQRRSGGAGVYYHLSYLGVPKPYLWINTTPPSLMWTEMHKALAYGADRIWVLNVGDIKPGEIGMEFWTKLAWNTKRYDEVDAQTKFLTEFAAREFPSASPPASLQQGVDDSPDAATVAGLLNRFFDLCAARKPELLEANAFSPEQSRQRLVMFSRLLQDAEALSPRLPAEKRDAFYELVLYPIRVAALTNEAYASADLSRLAASQSRPIANAYADRAAAAVASLKADVDYYNNTLAGGKWRGMMTLGGMSRASEYANWDAKWFMRFPAGERVTPASARDAAIGVAIDGRSTPLLPRDAKRLTATPGDVEDVDLKFAAIASLPAPWQRNPEGTIGVPNGSGNAMDSGKAVSIPIDFTLTTPGKYTLFAAVNIDGGEDDSWFLRIDDGPWQVWNEIAATDGVQWRRQGVHELQAGKHRLMIANREDGAMIRSLRFTQRADPEGAGDGPANLLPTIVERVPMRDRATFSVFSTDGSLPKDTIVRSNDTWIIIKELADASARNAGERRFAATIDWIDAPADAMLKSSVNILTGDASLSLTLDVIGQRNKNPSRTFVEVDGVVSIEAEHFERKGWRPSHGAWKIIPNLGRSGDAVTVMPETEPSNEDVAKPGAESPSLSYDIDITTLDGGKLLAYCLPTYRIHEGRGLRLAVSIDDGKPQIIDLAEDGGRSGEGGPRWNENKRSNLVVGTAPLQFMKPGKHTLKLWMVDPGVVVDQLVIDFRDAPTGKRSELAPPETRCGP